MAKKMKKLLGIAMAAVLCTASVVPALAVGEADSVIDVVISIPETGNSQESVSVETKGGSEQEIKAKVETTVTENEDGSTRYEADINAKNANDGSGNKVDYKGKVDVTVDESGNIIDGTADVNYSVSGKNYTAEGGYSADYNVADDTAMNGASVDVPLVEGGSNTVVSDDQVGDKTVTGDQPTGANDGKYDYTTSTVVKPGSVTVETTDIDIKENISEDTDMEYVKSETVIDHDSVDNKGIIADEDRDLVLLPETSGGASEEYLPGYEGEVVIPEGVPGYDYVYVGSGNTSKLVPAIVFDKPMSDEDKLAQYGDGAYIKKNSITYYYVGWLKEEDKARIAKDADNNYITDAEGYILDIDGNRIFKEERTAVGPNGETTYLHRFDNFGDSLKVEGWFEDGEWKKELNGDDGYYAIWAGPQQFVLVDAEGNIITAYCADFSTPTQDSFGYNMENLEDATYYSDEEAKQIRSIAANGYWGTTEGVGSLLAMKAILLASGQFTEEELASLSDGVALTATQMAIWSCSNKMTGIEFINAHYSNWGVKNGKVPTEKEDEVKLMFKLYDYLINLAPTELENTTRDTIINADNFVDNMNVTVVEKVSDHENNKDDDRDNDAYYVDLSFALVVTPSTENGDDLVVKVIDAEGNVIATGRVAGELAEGETMLTPDTEGNYTFANIVLTEGEQNFNLTLEGIQNLEEGVYLYTSQVVEETSSQTLVGLAGGQRGVDVSMNIKFDFNVEDQIVAKERTWRSEETTTTRRTTPPPPTRDIPEEPVPLSDDPGLLEILDEEIPLAAAPETGDNSIVYVLMSLISLCGISLLLMKKNAVKDN